MKNSKTLKFIWWIYIILLFLIVIVKFKGSFAQLENKISATPFGANCNIIPFDTIKMLIDYYSEGWARLNIFGNIIPFMPFGFFLPLAFGKMNKFRFVFICGLSFVLFAEIFQFFTRLGSFDIDDIFLNMIGIISGYLIMKFFKVDIY